MRRHSTRKRPRGSSGAIAASFVALTLLVAAYMWISTPGTARIQKRDRRPVSRLPEPVQPAFRPEITPSPLSSSRSGYYWAPVVRRVTVRASPDEDAAEIATLTRRTPEGTANIVLALARVNSAMRIWVKVRLPVLPNNTTGWVPRTALGGYREVHTHLVIDLERLTATLFRSSREVFRTAVGVGRRGSATPRGEFYIRNRLTNFDDPFYGPLAFGTSARSSDLTDWPAGGFIGIHGTNRPALIPGRISHGCIRMKNSALRALARLMPVGTPVTIQ